MRWCLLLGLLLWGPAVQAAVFEDHFAEGADTNVSAHTPDTTGTSWTQIQQINTTCVAKIFGASDQFAPSSTTATSAGELLSADITYPSANYEVNAKKVGTDISDDTVFLAARIQDADNMYGARFNDDGATLYKRVSSTWTSLGTSLDIAQNNQVELTVNGTTIAWDDDDDGTDEISVTDSDISAAGKAGAGMAAVAVSTDDCSNEKLDDFIVTDLGGGAASHRIFLVN